MADRFLERNFIHLFSHSACLCLLLVISQSVVAAPTMEAVFVASNATGNGDWSGDTTPDAVANDATVKLRAGDSGTASHTTILISGTGPISNGDSVIQAGYTGTTASGPVIKTLQA